MQSIPKATYSEKLRKNVNSKKSVKTRASIQFCQERLACRGNKPLAHFECGDCGTSQCELCEQLLHENYKFEFHTRTPLSSPPKHLLCESDCEERNYCDVHCVNCQLNLCSACDLIIHSTPNKRTHKRQAFQIDCSNADDDNDEFISFPLQNTLEAVEQLDNVDLESGSDSELHHSKHETPNKNEITDTDCDLFVRNSRLPDIAQLSLDSHENPAITPITATTGDNSGVNSAVIMSTHCNFRSSFLLIDENELLQVNTSEDFAIKLGCAETALLKVVSIFGNTGEGKSHTLNYTFFDGNEMFKTSPTQSSCTIGIWCAYDPICKVITIDTEGLLGISENNNRRTRLLLKALAISDIIIYRTRAERLHNDLFTFLGDASRAYVQHFSKELRATYQRCNFACPLADLGPIIIIFHETLHTETLRTENDLTPEDIIRQRFQHMELSTEAFSAFEYVGTRTANPPTNFKKLQHVVKNHLKNSTVRSARTSTVVFNSLKLLNEKFSGDINKTIFSTFPDEYFTCSSHCLSCNARCVNSMNHTRDGIKHASQSKCKYQHQFDNQEFYCRACNDRGEEVKVIPKTSSASDSAWLGIARYAWSGFVLECTACGVIYRSRQYWYGNKDPIEQSVVRTQINHRWEDETFPSHVSQNAAQRVVDSVNYLSETVTTIGAKPSKIISSWVADQIAPAYWMPNARIKHCGICNKEFGPIDHKHHCRACGGGFCEECSSKFRPVPERGWGDQPVRVCNTCHEVERAQDSGNPEITARMVGEVLQTTIGSVVSAIEGPLGWIKESARPEYWIPDKDINKCNVCQTEFNEKIAIHHCRACGHGICDKCSQNRKPVPSRGWDQAVRICDNCEKKS